MKFRIGMMVAVVIVGLLGYLAFGQESAPKKRSGSSYSGSSSSGGDAFKNFKMQ